MNDVIFKFSVMSMEDNGIGFVFVSDGSNIEYRGKNREGKPMMISFAIPEGKGDEAYQHFMSALRQVSCESDGTDLNDGYTWCLRTKNGGMIYDTEGMLHSDAELIPLSAQANDLMQIMEAYYTEDSANRQNMDTILKNAPFFSVC